MSYVETSAIVGILLQESDYMDLLSRLETIDGPFTSVVSAVEAALGVGRVINDMERGARLVSAFLDQMNIRLVAAPTDIYDDVMRAAARYGKRSGHSANLNFGDCFSYAFAKRAGGRILFKGEDFSRTDLTAV